MMEKSIKYYQPLAYAAGIGSMLGSGIIVSLSATIGVWQKGLGLTNGQVGILSGLLTFAIAFGSLFGGRIAESLGLIRTFNWINLLYAVGALGCVFANSFYMLLLGVIIAGVSSGADLPVSLTVVSRDAPDSEMSAKLVSSTQIFWQIGIFISYICSFMVSTMSGAMGARIVFGILTVIAVIAWLWRTLSSRFKQLHDEGAEHFDLNSSKQKSVSVTKVLFGKNGKVLIKYFIAILIFYVTWNLLANTWGQFQTFILIKANASQSLATGAGIVLNIVALTASVLFSRFSGKKYRVKAFVIGSIIMFAAMVGMTMAGANIWITMGSLALYMFGSPLSGEALYKVWTQESFPIEIRSSVQGIINGTSRFCCALFALVTPALVVPGAIKTTMWAFAGVIVISFIAGVVMIKLQKKYGIDDDNK